MIRQKVSLDRLVASIIAVQRYGGGDSDVCFCCYLWVRWDSYQTLYDGDTDCERCAVGSCDAVEYCSDCVGLGVRSDRWRYVVWIKFLTNYPCDGDGDHERNDIGGVMCLSLILTAHG